LEADGFDDRVSNLFDADFLVFPNYNIDSINNTSIELEGNYRSG
jgi:hypothetical protein